MNKDNLIYKGECPVCHEMVEIGKDHKIERHDTKEENFLANLIINIFGGCAGTGQYPIEGTVELSSSICDEINKILMEEESDT